MNNRNIWILFAALFMMSMAPLYSQVSHRVYLFGNYADVVDVSFFNQKLKNQLKTDLTPFTLILNGDMVNAQVEKDDQINLKRIYALMDMIEEFPQGKLILIPGDRDWNDGKRGGQKSLRNLEEQVKEYIEEKDYDKTKWAIKNECPGPTVYDDDEVLAIVALNSQWWNHSYDKPKPSDGVCKVITPENLGEAIEDAIEDNLDKNVLIVGHHPIFSLGHYGGYFSVGDQMKPFPLVGSFRTAFHANIGNKRDIHNPNLASYISQMDNLLYFHSNIIYASSHEHNQQINRRDRNVLINSGAPNKGDYATANEHTLVSNSNSGIIAIDYLKNGEVNSTFFALDETGFKTDFEQNLFTSSCIIDEACNPEYINDSYVPCNQEIVAATEMKKKYVGTTQVVGGSQYDAGGFKSTWLGKHYRSTWTEPVAVPYLDLDTTHNGLIIYKKGGGRQTTSLKFKTDQGTVYSFRSVDKDPAKALGYKLRNSVAASVFRDQTSTEQPYGAMAVAPLLDNLNILHVTPTLYILPDDPKLGSFQAKYGNLLGMLEENPSKPNLEGKYFGNSDGIEHSFEVFKELYNNQNYRIAEEEFVRARLFDIMVGDWSKHENNWKWALYDEPDGVVLYRPIPRDRDHVFSKQDGILPWIADRRFAAQNIEGFDLEYGDIRSLTNQATHMDRFLMTESDRKVFMDQAKYIQENLTESDIELAVRKMPSEIYELSGREVEEKLKNRLMTLQEAADEYYKYLAKEVEVVGSNEEEEFKITYLENGNIDITVVGEDHQQLYKRTFIEEDTKEVRVYGLGDDDSFMITGDGRSKIKVSSFGGPGDDIFTDSAVNQRTYLYDNGEKTEYKIEGKAKEVNHWNKKIYDYDRSRFGYNFTLPLASIGYDQFLGLGISLGALFTISDYKKDNFHSTHRFGIGITTMNNFSIFYESRFNQAIKKWDATIDAVYADGDFVNFFYGIGNNTVKDDGLFQNDYYGAVVDKYGIYLGLVRDFWLNSSFKFNAGIEQNESQQISNTFLNDNAATIFGAEDALTIVPLATSLDIDFRDSKGLPYKGIRAVIEYENGTILTSGGNNYGVASGAIEYYVSTRSDNPLTFATRVGGNVSHGEIPWYKLPSLGDRNGLRGYFQNRFSGEKTSYINFEIRYQFFSSLKTFIPLKAGVKAFYDTGRVFADELENNDGWRSGYGFGFYLVPLSESFTLSVSFGFSEEESIYPSIAIGTPLR